MTDIFNRQQQKARRRSLRKNMPGPERVLWSRLRARQMEGVRFRRQFGIGPYIVDFHSPELQLAIELDGDSHYQAGAQSPDARRQRFIESLGIRVLRFTNTDITGNLAGVLEVVRAEVLRLKSGPGPQDPL